MQEATAPDFYLSSSDSYEFEEPRRCWKLRQLGTETRKDFLLIRVAPPLIGQRHGLKDRDPDILIVATRHHGDSLFPIKHWPVFVHIMLPRVAQPQAKNNIAEDEYELIAWGELYKSEQDARRKKM